MQSLWHQMVYVKRACRMARGTARTNTTGARPPLYIVQNSHSQHAEACAVLPRVLCAAVARLAQELARQPSQYGPLIGMLPSKAEVVHGSNLPARLIPMLQSEYWVGAGLVDVAGMATGLLLALLRPL